jgi:ribonuclease E
MRRPSYFQRLLPKPASVPVLTPPRQLMRPFARGFETLDIEQPAYPSAGRAAIASQSPAASALQGSAPSKAQAQSGPRPDRFETPGAPAFAPTRPIVPQARPMPRAHEANPSTPQAPAPMATAAARRPPGAAEPASSGPDAPELHPRLETLNRAAERFAGKIPASGNTAAPPLEPPPAGAALAQEPKQRAATSVASQPPPVAPHSSGVAATSSAPSTTNPAFVHHAVPAEPLRPKLPLRAQAAPPPPQRPSVTIGTLEVRVTPPAQNAPPRPAMKAPRRAASIETRGLSRPVAAFGFGQT